MNKYKLTTLKNGLKIITVPMKNSDTVTLSITVSTGADYESKKEDGLSHFLEHMFFKGTKKRTAKRIRGEIKSIGAHHNAFTSSFLTHYYVKSHKKFFAKILDILSDSFLNSTFPEKEIEKERGVILSEIDMYNDSPAEVSYIALGNLMYKNQTASNTILGPKKNIERFKRSDFMKYKDRHYYPSQTTITVVGDIDGRKVINEIKRIFDGTENRKKMIMPEKIRINQKTPGISAIKKKTEQTHITIGIHTFGRLDKREETLALLNLIFGGTSSSRLWNTIREDLGLVYHISSSIYSGYDYGRMEIYMGVDHKNAETAIKALMKEMRLIRERGVTEEEIKRFKAYTLGSQALIFETTSGLSTFYGAQPALMYKKISTPKELYAERKKVTKKSIDRLAKEIFQNKNINLCVVGPHNKSKFKKIFRL